MADGAAHHARVALDHHAVDAAARVDAVVGGDLQPVALLQPFLVDVEAVGVLHAELARAQDAALGPRLVALLGLDVVPHLRELLVAVDLPRGQPGDHLFVGHGQRHVGALAVLEAEHLAADGVPAAALLPDLRRLQHRHEHLLAADAVHLLTDDLRDLLHDAPAGRQVHVDAGGELAHEAGADHELVAHGLRAGGILFDGGKKQLADAHGASRSCVADEVPMLPKAAAPLPASVPRSLRWIDWPTRGHTGLEGPERTAGGSRHAHPVRPARTPPPAVHGDAHAAADADARRGRGPRSGRRGRGSPGRRPRPAARAVRGRAGGAGERSRTGVGGVPWPPAGGSSRRFHW